MPYVLELKCGHKAITWIHYEAGGVYYCDDCKFITRIANVRRTELAA